MSRLLFTFFSEQIYDGFIEEDAVIGRFCGSSVPPVITSKHNVVYVQFKADDSWTFSGFNVTYSTFYGKHYITCLLFVAQLFVRHSL